MTTEPSCCQGLPEHTYGEGCLVHRESFDIGTEDGRKALARKVADDLYQNGGVLHPGIVYIRLEPGEYVLSGEDIRRLLEGEEGA